MFPGCARRFIIEMVAVADLPLARYHRCHSIIAMRVGLDRRVLVYEQQNCVKARFCGIPEQHFRVDPRKPRASDLGLIERTAPQF